MKSLNPCNFLTFQNHINEGNQHYIKQSRKTRQIFIEGLRKRLVEKSALSELELSYLKWSGYKIK